MPLYPLWSNTVYRVAVVALVVIAASLVLGPMIFVRTTYNTSQFVPWEQPVEFDHRHHVRDDGIECQYCHAAVERSSSAGVATTGVCMGCHAQIWNDSPLLELVRQSYFTGRPINWKRVHDLPDFVYFDHSVHVARGVTCEHCHGDVGQMARVVQVQPLTMGWCLDCHRRSSRAQAPTPAWPTIQIPPADVPSNAWEAVLEMFEPDPVPEPEIGLLTTCTACHR